VLELLEREFVHLVAPDRCRVVAHPERRVGDDESKLPRIQRLEPQEDAMPSSSGCRSVKRR
jgi:hypothetical protein